MFESVKARVEKTKNFVDENKVFLAYCTGAVAGSVCTGFLFTKFPPPVKALALATDEDITKVLDELKGGFLVFPGKNIDIALVSQNFAQKVMEEKAASR